ncbi:unnamed protein product [Ectocarpus sp. 12 AP-2014]
MPATGLGQQQQQHHFCGNNANAVALVSPGSMMASLMRRSPIRCQALADTVMAQRGLSMTSRELAASRQCGDIPTETLSLDDDFVVINKPADVRMDGNFDVAVDKLIRYWCPTLEDKELKWVHQLDFATSGVLCVALHREAAARGCEAFRERRAKKSYLAVVQGAVDPESVPRRDEEPEGWGEGRDGTGGGGGGGRKRRPDSVQHTPAHGFFQRKKDLLLRAIELGETLSPEDLAFSKLSWGDIKFDKAASRPFHSAARADKIRAVAEAEAARFQAAQGAPDRGVFRAPGDGEGELRVDASVSEVPGDFRMRLDEEAGGKGKPSRTFVKVLEHGSYRGRLVTKVLMRPHTGRRHQLRLHALHMGHPILGDTTYGDADHTIPRMCLHAQSLTLRLAPPSDAACSDTEAPAKQESGGGVSESAAAAAAVSTEGASSQGGGGGGRGKRYWGRQEVQPAKVAGGEQEVILDVVAPDPFVFVDGELQL